MVLVGLLQASHGAGPAAGSRAWMRLPICKYIVMQLLPVPNQEDIDGFIALIEKLYGKEDMPREEASDILGRLMRFYYLTRLKPHLGEAGKGGEADGSAEKPIEGV